MTTPDNTQEPEQDVQELTEENLEEVSGGAAVTALLGVEPGPDLHNPGCPSLGKAFQVLSDA